MKTVTFRSAGRTYDVRVVPRDHHHHEPLPIAQEMIAESRSHGEARHIDGYLVVLPPETETDSAYRLHTFNPEAEPTAFDGIDALCAFEAYHETEARPTASLALRLGSRVATLSSVGREDGVVEADLGKPSLDPADAGVDVSDFTPIQMPHTFEIELEDESEPVIVTLVALEGLHAVIFTQNLDDVPLDRIGPALHAHPSLPDCSTHVAANVAPGEVELRSWHAGWGVTDASGLGLGAISAAGVTNCCTLEANAARLPDGRLAASWDGDGHVRLRGRVDAQSGSPV
ncbi:MAG: hypothetical protein ACOC1G_02210 [Phycisphaeraceae bacterium]